MFDPFKPQEYNVAIGNEPEAADDQPRHPFVAPPLPYEAPAVALIEADASIYPPRRHGVLPNRRGL